MSLDLDVCGKNKLSVGFSGTFFFESVVLVLVVWGPFLCQTVDF